MKRQHAYNVYLGLSSLETSSIFKKEIFIILITSVRGLQNLRTRKISSIFFSIYHPGTFIFFLNSNTIFITRVTKTLNPEDLQQIFQCYHQGTFMLFAIQNPRRLFIFFFSNYIESWQSRRGVLKQKSWNSFIINSAIIYKYWKKIMSILWRSLAVNFLIT